MLPRSPAVSQRCRDGRGAKRRGPQLNTAVLVGERETHTRVLAKFVRRGVPSVGLVAFCRACVCFAVHYVFTICRVCRETSCRTALRPRTPAGLPQLRRFYAASLCTHKMLREASSFCFFRGGLSCCFLVSPRRQNPVVAPAIVAARYTVYFIDKCTWTERTRRYCSVTRELRPLTLLL